MRVISEDQRERLDTQTAALETGLPVTTPELDDETSRRLEELGYIQ